MKKLIIALISLSATAAVARPYGDAGCGLGSVMFGNNGSQVLASTTNSSSYTQFFGITSGTSNCVEDGVAKNDMQLPLFIEANKEALASDVARGNGEALAGLSQIMGCSSTALAPTLKQNYKAIFVDTKMQPAGIEKSIQTVVKSSQVCGA